MSALARKGAAMPEGFQPLVQLEMPDGERTTPNAIAITAFPQDHARTHEQIRRNMALGLPSLRRECLPHDRRMVLACYGPSLRETWEQAAAEPGDLWTVSGAHSFLVERDVAPAFHTDVDPRPHKAWLLRHICPTTHFYLPSRVSPEFFTRTEGRQRTLWHLDVKQERAAVWEADPAAMLCSPAITAGLCAVRLGIALGYRSFSIYGMDGSAANGEKYGGAHPNGTEPFNSLVEVEGRQFATNMLMLLAVQDFFALAAPFPVGTFTFHGDGLIPWIEKVARRAHGK